ncbi:MAG: hypothetical protein IPP19_15970 [Verrucomicrobia bacterium]|nr:hypothetical protein [Verrucomicrobiota bacterium]
MKHLSFLLILAFVLCGRLTADSTAYNGKLTISAVGGNFGVVHIHDWSSGKIPALFNDLANHEAFLGEANDFSFIQLFDANQKSVFLKPSPALTVIWISPDSKFIVGLSSIMRNNPYQLMIWRIDGTLVYKKHISASVAKISPQDLEEFYQKYPAARAIFRDRYMLRGRVGYLDYGNLGASNSLGDDAWNDLYARDVPNPYSDDFSSSVKDRITWFDEKEPDLAITETPNTIKLSLRSPSGKLVQIAFPKK